MGIFNYTCCLGKKGCEIKADQTGQECTYGTIYATDSEHKKKCALEYSGYGYANLKDYDPDNIVNIYDLGHSDYFSCWDLQPEDKKAFMVCPTCAKHISIEVDDFDKLEEKDTKIVQRKILTDYEIQLEELITERDNINKQIRSIRAKIKRLNK